MKLEDIGITKIQSSRWQRAAILEGMAAHLLDLVLPTSCSCSTTVLLLVLDADLVLDLVLDRLEATGTSTGDRGEWRGTAGRYFGNPKEDPKPEVSSLIPMGNFFKGSEGARGDLAGLAESLLSL